MTDDNTFTTWLVVLMRKGNHFTLIDSYGYQLMNVNRKIAMQILTGDDPRDVVDFKTKDAFYWKASYTNTDEYCRVLEQNGYREVCCWYDESSMMTVDIKRFFNTLRDLKTIKKTDTIVEPKNAEYITLTGFAAMTGIKPQTLVTKLQRVLKQREKGKPSRAKIPFPIPITKTNAGYLWSLEQVQQYVNLRNTKLEHDDDIKEIEKIILESDV